MLFEMTYKYSVLHLHKFIALPPPAQETIFGSGSGSGSGFSSAPTQTNFKTQNFYNVL
jgi:hypothetical protein